MGLVFANLQLRFRLFKAAFRIFVANILVFFSDLSYVRSKVSFSLISTQLQNIIQFLLSRDLDTDSRREFMNFWTGLQMNIMKLSSKRCSE